MQKVFEPLPEETEKLAKKIFDAALKVHRKLGPGLLERVYEVCLCYELEKLGLHVQRQLNVPIVYDGIEFEEGYRIDLIVNKTIIVELKASESFHPVWQAQVLSYLKVIEKRLGMIINFNVPLLKNGVKRVIL